MSVLIKSIIKTASLGQWYIELHDTTKENQAIRCQSVNEYADVIEAIGAEHGGEVEVSWSSDADVTKEQINEIRMQMNAYEAEQKAREAAQAKPAE